MYSCWALSVIYFNVLQVEVEKYLCTDNFQTLLKLENYLTLTILVP